MSGGHIRRLLAEGTLTRVHRDAYRIPLEREHPIATFHAAVTALRLRDPTRVLAGPAALSALGLPVFDEPTTLHVVTDRGGGPSARSLMSTVAVPPADQLVTVGGTVMTGPARAVLDTARLQSLVAGVVAADEALRTGRTSVTELRQVAGTMSRLRNTMSVRLCCDLASSQSESPGESWSAVVMHRHGIERPQRQETFSDHAGFVGRVDFWWPHHQTLGEFDGRIKYGRTNLSGSPPEQVLWDEKLREDRLRALGLAVVRWTTADLRSPRLWIQRLLTALRQQ